MAAKFNAGEPLAYFLTWTTYGSRLPGDKRGWTRKEVRGIHGANPLFVDMARSRMREPAFILSETHRSEVQATIHRHCEIRGWTSHAVNVRINHVHVVVTAPRYRPETVRDQFKSWCTRKLKETVPARTQFWTEGGNCRWINRENDLESAIIYVLEAQDRKGVDESGG